MAGLGLFLALPLQPKSEGMMPKICYIDRNFAGSSLEVIDQVNAIIEEYEADGFSLTLRQIYYQMVARAMIVNSYKSYKRLGSIINDARNAGLIDWEAIEDRTRSLRGPDHWASPDQILASCIRGYAIDKWEDQPYRVEVWVEKDALAGIVSRACTRLDIDYFSTRGYASSPELWKAARRLDRYVCDAQQPVILHLADHDPSGLDMTRDIQERLDLYMEDGAAWVERIGLNMDQIRQYDPPPNWAKVTDSRAAGYIQEYGRQSWELDALDPGVLMDLISDHVLDYRDSDLFEKQKQLQEAQRGLLQQARAWAWENRKNGR